MKTLFIHSKPVLISDKESKNETPSYPRLTILQNPQPDLLPTLLDKLKEEASNGYHFIVDNPSETWESLLKNFNHWQAAGGLVLNTAGEILFLFRRGKWDLPKGKMDAGENPEETALREVTEETGLKNIKIIQKLTDTWHSYPLSVYKNLPQKEADTRKDILKQTHWFKMEFTGSELTIPQIEEDIIDIQWIKPENTEKYLNYSYPNIRQVFKAAGF